MKERTHSLRVNATTSAAWAQLLDETGAAYSVKAITNVYAEVESITVLNLGPQNATVQVAFSTTNTPVNSGIQLSTTLNTNADVERTATRLMRPGEGAWLLPTATNCNVVAHIALREKSGE